MEMLIFVFPVNGTNVLPNETNKHWARGITPQQLFPGAVCFYNGCFLPGVTQQIKVKEEKYSYGVGRRAVIHETDDIAGVYDVTGLDAARFPIRNYWAGKRHPQWLRNQSQRSNVAIDYLNEMNSCSVLREGQMLSWCKLLHLPRCK